MSTGLPGPGPGSRRWGQRLRAAGYRCGGRLSCDACRPRVLSLILAMAVKDGRLARNAAAGVSLPRVVREERQYLTHTEVERLAEACAASPGEPISKHRRFSERRHQEYRLIVPFLAYPGVRFGELAAPRVGRLDFRRRRAIIAESVTLVGSPPGLWHSHEPRAPRGADSAVPRRGTRRPGLRPRPG